MKLNCDLCGGELRMQAGKVVCSVCGIEYGEERLQEKMVITSAESVNPVQSQQSGQKANKGKGKMILMWAFLVWIAVAVVVVAGMYAAGQIPVPSDFEPYFWPTLFLCFAVYEGIILLIFRPWKYYGGKKNEVDL